MFRVLVPGIVSIRDGQCYIKVCLLYLWLLYLTFYRLKNISTCYNLIFAHSEWTRFRYSLLFIVTFKCSLTCVCFWKWKCNERERGHQTSTGRSQIRKKQWRIQEEGPGGPDPLIRTGACLRLKFFMERIVYHFLTQSINQSINQSIKQAIFYLPLNY